MTDFTCDRVQDLLPDHVAGRTSVAEIQAVDAHLATGCESCAAALDVVRALHAAPAVPVPEGLEARLQSAARAALAETTATRPARRRAAVWSAPQWALAAAAALVLAIGIPQLTQRSSAPLADALDDATVLAQVEAYLPAPFGEDDDVLLAGAPVFDGLSDEALLQLLDEMMP